MSEVVVPAGWLADRLDEVAIVDVRDAWEFDGIGHVPGAVNIPFDAFRASEHRAESETQDGEQGMLPGAETFATLLSKAGITNDDEIVAYDDTHGVFAARFLVTAELYGHDPEKLHLLDGDFSAWQLDHETTSETTPIEPTSYEAALLPADQTPLIDQATMADAIDSDVVIVDTRDDDEYEAGHIPGAVQLDWRELVDDESRGLKPRDEIEDILAERDITPEKQVVLYCNTARRISHTYTVLRHLGYETVAFYEGSLTEWEADDRPLETGR
ncbi:MAG: sulfurtransferase [Halorientalis sp.]